MGRVVGDGQAILLNTDSSSHRSPCGGRVVGDGKVISFNIDSSSGSPCVGRAVGGMGKQCLSSLTAAAVHLVWAVL